MLLELHSDGGPMALRVRDLSLPRLVKIDLYPYDPEWVIAAEWRECKTSGVLYPTERRANHHGGIVLHRRFYSAWHRGASLLATHWKSGKPCL